MSIFLTGTTGYIGAYLATMLLREHPEAKLDLLVRAADQRAGRRRLWQAWQLHMPFEEFIEHVESRVEIYLGDLTRPGFGLERARLDGLIRSMGSVIHCAASLNRKSAKACFNVNLRGTLEVINQRVVRELGETPAPFGSYASGLMRFAMEGGFRYAYRP